MHCNAYSNLFLFKQLLKLVLKRIFHVKTTELSGYFLFLQSLILRMQMISRLAKNSGCSALLERYYKTNKSVLLVVIDQ